MPIFEFHCSNCDEDFEELLPSGDERDQVKCPSCGARRVGRKFSVFSARSAQATGSPSETASACGRCGDPHGPCSV